MSREDAAAVLGKALELLKSPETPSLIYATLAGPADLRNDSVAAQALVENASRLLAFDEALSTLSSLIEDARQTQNNALNRCASIAHLPAEVLQMILIEGFRVATRSWLPFWLTPVPYLRSITSTCARWRSVAMASPVLWSFILLDWPADVVDLWLTRSPPRFGLHVQGPRLTQRAQHHRMTFGRQSETIFERFEDWASLGVQISSEFVLEDLWKRVPRRDGQVGGPRFPCLESFAVVQTGPGLLRHSSRMDADVASLDYAMWLPWRSDDHSDSPSSRSRHRLTSQTFLPRLRRLTLWTVPFHPSHMLETVTDLDIRYKFSALPWSSWETILRQAANLETLRLSRLLVSSYDEASNVTSQHPWRKLRSLTLGPGLEDRFIQNVLSLLESPDLRQLSVALMPKESESALIAQEVINCLGTSPRLEILKLAGYEPFLSPILTNIADSRAYSGGHHESPFLHQSGLSVFTPVPLLKSLYLGILPTRIDRKPIWRALRSLYTVSETSSPSSPHPTARRPALVISPKYVDVDRWFPEHVENFRIEPSSSEGTLWVSPDSLSDNADDFERFYRLSKKARRKFPGIYVPPPEEDSDSEWYD